MKALAIPSTIALLFAAACSSSQPITSNAPATTPATATAPANAASQDIVDLAANNADFSTLVTAIKAAGLVDALKARGPFTVFAPTNAAFAKLPKGTLESLLADKAKLRQILTYHVVSGKVMAADVAGIDSAKTLQGQSVAIDTSDGVQVGNAGVIATDIVATNGVIHAIDTVLIPQ